MDANFEITPDFSLSLTSISRFQTKESVELWNI